MGSKFFDKLKELDTILSVLQKIVLFVVPAVIVVILAGVGYFRGLPLDVTMGLFLGWVTWLVYVVLYVVRQKPSPAALSKPKQVATLELHQVIREEIDKSAGDRSLYSIQKTQYSSLAILASFRIAENSPVNFAHRVVARLVYENFTGKTVLNVDFGAWLNTWGGENRIRKTDTIYLILAMQDRFERTWAAPDHNPNYANPQKKPLQLPGGVEVTLIIDDHPVRIFRSHRTDACPSARLITSFRLPQPSGASAVR